VEYLSVCTHGMAAAAAAEAAARPFLDTSVWVHVTSSERGNVVDRTAVDPRTSTKSTRTIDATPDGLVARLSSWKLALLAGPEDLPSRFLEALTLDDVRQAAAYISATVGTPRFAASAALAPDDLVWAALGRVLVAIAVQRWARESMVGAAAGPAWRAPALDAWYALPSVPMNPHIRKHRNTIAAFGLHALISGMQRVAEGACASPVYAGQRVAAMLDLGARLRMARLPIGLGSDDFVFVDPAMLLLSRRDHSVLREVYEHPDVGPRRIGVAAERLRVDSAALGLATLVSMHPVRRTYGDGVEDHALGRYIRVRMRRATAQDAMSILSTVRTVVTTSVAAVAQQSRATWAAPIQIPVCDLPLCTASRSEEYMLHSLVMAPIVCFARECWGELLARPEDPAGTWRLHNAEVSVERFEAAKAAALRLHTAEPLVFSEPIRPTKRRRKAQAPAVPATPATPAVDFAAATTRQSDLVGWWRRGQWLFSDDKRKISYE